MFYRGRPFAPQSYGEAFAHGVSRVFQEQSLILNVPVFENMVLSQERRYTRWGQFVDRGAMIRVAEKIVEEAGLDVDVRRNAGAYDFSRRQALEIARACLAPKHLMGIEDPLVLLDEPTSALDKKDETAFIDLLTRMKRHAAFIFVSHRLTEIREISDTIVVMKDGRLSGSLLPEAADEKTLHGLMVGRDRAQDYYQTNRQRDVAGGRPVCTIRNLSDAEFGDVSFELRAGEVLGIGGLLDSGKSALGKAIAGVQPPKSGTMALKDRAPQRPRIGELVREGVGYVPAERLVEGIVPAFSLAVNSVTAELRPIFAQRDLAARQGEGRGTRCDPTVRHSLGNTGHTPSRPVGRQPAKSRTRSLAATRPQPAGSRQSDAGRRFGRQGGDLPAYPGPDHDGRRHHSHHRRTHGAHRPFEQDFDHATRFDRRRDTRAASRKADRA